MLNFPPLPDPQNYLLNIAKESRGYWREAAALASKLASGEGIASDKLKESCKKLEMIAKEGSVPLQAVIETPLDVRACAGLWLASDEFLDDAPVSADILKRFKQVKKKLNFMVFMGLLQLLLKKYEHVGDLKALQKFITKEIGQLDPERLPSSLQKLQRSRSDIFGPSGYNWISSKAQTEGVSVEIALNDAGINTALRGRFSQLCIASHYLNLINKLDPQNTNSSFFKEISSKRVIEIHYKRALLGHAIIERLIQRAITLGHDMPEHWLKLILSIAGDPRVPKTSENYSTWWARIEPKLVQLVAEWLGKFDLDLFLNILKQASKKSTDEALRRMFPDREPLLQALIKAKTIRGARLFLGGEAREFLRQQYRGRQDELPQFANLSDDKTSVIYLKLDNGFIIEGTHNFFFRIYDKYPEPNYIESYERTSFSRNFFASLVPTKYFSEFKEEPWKTVHNGNWKSRVIAALEKRGVRLDPEVALSAGEYQSFKAVYGVSRWKRR